MATAILHLRSELLARFELPAGIRQTLTVDRIPTGIPVVDRLTAGGFPRGFLSEIGGAETTGRTALTLALLSQATRNGECCAWIDVSGAFDPASAAAMGVDLTRVLWVDCGGSAERALKSADLLIQAGGFGLVVFDLADTPDREARRISLASWFRLRHAAEHTHAALVTIGRQFNAQSCSTLRIEMRRKRPVWIGKLLRRLDIAAESRKQYTAPTGQQPAASVSFTTP
jgi:recombination protein RecA